MRHKPGVNADRLRIRITGNRARWLLSAAVREGIRLSRIHCVGGGYQASIAGHEWSRLAALADQGGCTAEVAARSGPGSLWEKICRRPGVAAGVVLFFLLQNLLGGYVWSIDFSALEPAEREAFRSVLARQGIWEGARLTQDRLLVAQNALTSQLDTEGWISLNFLDGRLVLERTVRDVQSVQPETPPGALYAAAPGEVVAIELSGGFSAVEVGQYVSEGQLLVNGQKADRDGDPVAQNAVGRVQARVQRTYTSCWQLQQEATILTGACTRQTVWHILGLALPAETHTNETGDLPQGEQKTSWQPIRLGRIALPASLCHTETWTCAQQPVVYSQPSAAAMARRDCRRQLLAEFPDAVIESEQVQTTQNEEAVTCTVRYTFLADIARSGELAPLPSADET